MKQLLIFFAFLFTLVASSEVVANQPNIVFFLIDDLGYSDCGFNGGKEILTPNIDKLAHGGTILESHYVQPVCSPTRAALMTGRYATKTGVYTIVKPHAQWGLPLGERTLANALHDAGYETAITGKWHLGEYKPEYLPMARGFDHQYGHYVGALDYFTHMRDRTQDWYRDDKPLTEEGYTTHLIAKEACKIIVEKTKDKPLFLYVPFNGVHAPLQVPDAYLKPYEKINGPRLKLAGMLSAVDEAIGQIVETLEKSGQRENTLIIFSSDNGGPRPGINAPLRGFKGSSLEGGVRGCAFANWPGQIPAAATIKEPIHVIDWYPTLVKLANGKLGQKLPIDGRDIWPMLTKGGESPHDAILCVQAPAVAALRMGDWKLLMNSSVKDNEDAEEATPKDDAKKKAKAKAKSDTMELYNLATDIGEKTNLADQEPERVATMRAKLTEMLKDAVQPGQLGKEVVAPK